jgi:hypothetical protein
VWCRRRSIEEGGVGVAEGPELGRERIGSIEDVVACESAVFVEGVVSVEQRLLILHGFFRDGSGLGCLPAAGLKFAQLVHGAVQNAVCGGAGAFDGAAGFVGGLVKIFERGLGVGAAEEAP